MTAAEGIVPVLDQDTQVSEAYKMGRPGVSWTKIWVLLVPLGVLGAAGPSRVERTIETSANPLISLSNVTGRVTVKGWDRTRVHMVSTTASPQIEVDVEAFPPKGQADKIHFTTHILDSQMTGDKTTDYSLDVPLGSSVEIRNPEGSVQIQTLQGEASVASVGGTIAVSDVAGHLDVRTIGGDIEMVRPSGRVEAHSICGSLRLVSPTSSRVRAGTTSGKIFYEGDFLPDGNYELTDYSGDIEIVTPASASFELSARSARGKVITDAGISFTPKRHAAFRPPSGASSSFFGTHNEGKANVDLRSFSGTIRVRRLP
ncbi:MAG: hypothetical protein DMG27_06320 [Acidobacteria bacterium]|nr:MAG: hypothetical protein DMG27_06320 [Acidobacteriota bacterium]